MTIFFKAKISLVMDNDIHKKELKLLKTISRGK